VAGVSRRYPISAAIVLFLAACYFFIPLAATAQQSIHEGHEGYTLSAWRAILNDPEFHGTLWISFQLAVETTLVVLVLMVPTVYWLHLKAPRWRPLIEFITLLPFVVPPIVLIVGLKIAYEGRAPRWFTDEPKFLTAGYVVLAMPFAFRSLDVGMRAIDIHTLTEASQSLGASWTRTLLRVILPNLRSAVLSSAMLTLAIVLGEFTMASIALFKTYPVYIEQINTGADAYEPAALAILSVSLTFGAMLIALLLGRGRGSQVVLGAGGR
jgi:putative spermidine/putrescine transport system permease protein